MMKAKLGFCLLVVASYAAHAQVEVDDMYFNSKDRAKEREARQKENAYRAEREIAEEKENDPGINPTDSYSSRKVNPEYVSQQKSRSNDNDIEESEYFLSGYQPIGVNRNLGNNYYAPGAFSAPFYGTGWGSPMMSYSYGYSPFGSSFYPYSFWNDPFYNPYNSFGPFNSWSLSFGGGWGYSTFPMWGNPWNSFYGGSQFGNYYNSWAWGGGWNSWGSPYGYNYYSRYPTVIIVNDNGNSPRVVYGKRTDRSSSLNNDVDHSRSISSLSRTGREISSGRSRTANNEQSFYDRNWKSNPEVTRSNGRSYWGNESNSSSRTSSNGTTSTTTRQQRANVWSNDFFNNDNNSSNNNSRSWSNSSISPSGGSRSSSSSSGQSSSGGGSRSRGRD